VVSTGEYEPLRALSEPAKYFRTQHKWYWTDETFWELYFKAIGGPGCSKIEGTQAWLECVQEPHGPQMYLYIKKPAMLNG
jgi:hypothetical protein